VFVKRPSYAAGKREPSHPKANRALSGKRRRKRRLSHDVYILHYCLRINMDGWVDGSLVPGVVLPLRSAPADLAPARSASSKKARARSASSGRSTSCGSQGDW